MQRKWEDTGQRVQTSGMSEKPTELMHFITTILNNMVLYTGNSLREWSSNVLTEHMGEHTHKHMQKFFY